MKILMYGWEFPPLFSGGLGIACHAIVQELAKKQHQVTIVLPHTVENLISEEKVSIIGCDAVAGILQEVIGPQYQEWYNKYSSTSFSTFLNPYLHLTEPEYLTNIDCTAPTTAEIITQLQTLTRSTSLLELMRGRPQEISKLTGKYGLNLLAEVCYYSIIAGALASIVDHDIIHAHDWLTVLAGVEAKKRSGKPLIFHVHALETDRSGTWVDTRIFAIEKYGMEQADKIVAVSEYTKKIIVEKYGISPDKITVIHNGSYSSGNSDHIKIAPKKNKMVLFLGRLAHQKGPFFFIEAARKILEKRRDVHFVIAGTGGLWQEMIQYVASLRLGKYIHFTGFLDHKKINHIFNLADVYVMPSISEPFGISCLEALSYGVPVVISKQSGVAEVFPHVIKVDFWDTYEMANKILALLDHPALRHVIMRQSSQRLQGLTWEKTADSLISLYEQLICKP